MPRKPVRGRFFIKIATDDRGGSWACESVKDRSLTPVEVVKSLREYADFIETYFIKRVGTKRHD